MPHPGTVQSSIEYGSRTIYVYCMDFIGKDRCHYMAQVKLSDLPKITWAEIERRFLCPKCNAKRLPCNAPQLESEEDAANEQQAKHRQQRELRDWIHGAPCV